MTIHEYLLFHGKVGKYIPSNSKMSGLMHASMHTHFSQALLSEFGSPSLPDKMASPQLLPPALLLFALLWTSSFLAPSWVGPTTEDTLDKQAPKRWTHYRQAKQGTLSTRQLGVAEQAHGDVGGAGQMEMSNAKRACIIACHLLQPHSRRQACVRTLCEGL